MVDCWQYIFSFTEAEKKRIYRLYELREWKNWLAVLAGVSVAAGVFFSPLLMGDLPHIIHGYLTCGPIPLGIIVGAWVRHWIPRYVHRKWMTVWHPLAEERRAADGWETFAPPEPPSLREVIDRRYIGLDKSGCTWLVSTGLFLLLIIGAPAADTFPWMKIPWVILLLGFLPAGLIAGDLLGRD